MASDQRDLTMEEMEKTDAGRGAKRPADATPATTPPPAKQADTDSPLQFKISGLRDAVYDQVAKEVSKQLPDLLAKNERIQKMEEEIRELREENRQLREQREKDKAAHDELNNKFDEFKPRATKAITLLLKEINKRFGTSEQGKATKATTSKEV